MTGEGKIFSGAGFVVGPSLVATCFHVIEGAKDIAVTPLNKADDFRGAKVLRVDAERDIALLTVHGLTATPLRFWTGTDMYVGEPIYTIGNPRGLEGTFSTGILSNFHQLEGETYLLQFTASVSPGSSGGPLLNDKGEVIGIVSSQFNEGQNLNFAIAAIHLRILLKGSTAAPDAYLDNNLGRPRKP